MSTGLQVAGLASNFDWKSFVDQIMELEHAPADRLAAEKNTNNQKVGLLTTLGTKTFPIIQENAKRIITVSDNEIVTAMRLIWERLKIIVEPSGAVPLAAVLKEKENFRAKNVGIILSGGNIDLDRACALFAQH